MKLQKWHIGLAGLGAVALAVGLSSCVTMPKGAKVVRPFNKNRYLGKWYEICRLDFRFEKNLEHVTANYSLRTDGMIAVDNRGYHSLKKEWKESKGKAKPAGNSDEARLKVSFFGPFYAGYNVIALDNNYQYAMVAGNDLNYLWLLSREQTMPAAIITAYLKQAQELGYDVNKLHWTKHGPIQP